MAILVGQKRSRPATDDLCAKSSVFAGEGGVQTRFWLSTACTNRCDVLAGHDV